MRLAHLFPSRLTVLSVIGCLVLAPLAIWGGLSAGIAGADLVKARKVAEDLDVLIKAPETGYIARLTSCQVQLRGAQASVDFQNKAVEDLRATGAANEARADAEIRAARAQIRAAERRTQSVLAAQPEPGEGQCDAAFRLHQEYTE